MLYFAYGSNLNIEQMTKRCPKAVPVEAVVLDDARLVFRGVADIEYSEGDMIHGGVWKITKDCEKELDVYEGVENGLYRKGYFKFKQQRCLVYIMNKKGIMPPSEYYYNVIKEGYYNFRIPLDPLMRALEQSYEEKNVTPYLKGRRKRQKGAPLAKVEHEWSF